jgi:hypothetical protein
MSRSVPRQHTAVIAAWLASRGHNLMTAPESLIALALEAPDAWQEEPGCGAPRRQLPQGDDHWSRWF